MLCSAPKPLADAPPSSEVAMNVCYKLPPILVSEKAEPANATEAIAVVNNNLFFIIIDLSML